MALSISTRNMLISDEEEVRIISDYQFMEIIWEPDIHPSPTEPELLSSICHVCGSASIDMSDGHASCDSCNTETTFGVQVQVGTSNSISFWLNDKLEKPKLFFVKKYKDIVGDIKNRFKILDL